MKKLMLLLALLLSLPFGEDWGGTAYAQKEGQERVDSLQTALTKTGQDTNRITILNYLSSDNIGLGNFDTSIYFAKNALQLAQKLNFKKGEAKAFSNLGDAYIFQGNYPEASKNYQAALKIRESIGDKEGVAKSYIGIGNTNASQNNYSDALKCYRTALKIQGSIGDENGKRICYNNIANVHYTQANYPEALKNYLTALKINTALGEKGATANCYNNIGLVYRAQGNYPEALKNFLAALKIHEAIENKYGIANCYFNIGNIYLAQKDYSKTLKNYLTALKIREAIGDQRGIADCHANIGTVYSVRENYPEALKNYLAAMKINETIGDKNGIAVAYMNIGYINYLQDNYPEVLKNYLAALEINEAIGNKDGTAICYMSIGKMNVHMHKVPEGKVWLQKGLILSTQIGTKETIKDSYIGLAEADSALGNFKGALANYKMFISYRDSIYNEENTKKLTQTAMQYEFDKKQLADSLQNVQVKKLAAEKLSKQKTYTAMGAGLAILLLGFSGLVFRNNKKLAAEKQKSEDLLHNILPEEVSAELKQRGATTAKEFDAVTVLFTDFVNFTTAGERMSPKELVEELHLCFKTFDQIIDQYAIEKIKTVGDAYLAVSGLPNANEHHAQDIVKAAKEIKEFMLARRAALGDKTFEVRIGIHSGSVVAGIVGVKKFAYDIWGDTVNTAARMEQSGEAGKINISETTHQLVKDDFECAYRGEVDAKGKGKMKMYFVK